MMSLTHRALRSLLLAQCLTSALLFLTPASASAVTIEVPPPSAQVSLINNNEDTFPPLLDATLDDLRAGLDSGLFTSVDLVNAYIARIHEVHDELHPVTEINPDALSIAAELDRQRIEALSAGEDVKQQYGPLHGIPILIKDNIATDDAMNNTAGSYALLGAKVPRDSTMAAKLKKAGAIILGKTNLSQWAGARSFYNITQGWSAYGGQTYGAYYEGQDPSGSSSGSGVASSLGLAWACLGTETAGSISHPSHKNNLVGIKPTVGLTSRYLVVPISEHQDTVGPMARTVRDAAHLLAAIAGPDPRDNYTSAIPFDENTVPDYVAACKYSGLRGKRIGIPRTIMDNFPDVTANSTAAVLAFENALDILRSAGAEIIDNVAITSMEYFLQPNTTITGMDFFTDVPRYFSQLTYNPHNITTIEDLRNYTVHDKREAYPRVDVGTWDRLIARGMDNTSPFFWKTYTAGLYHAGHLGLTGAIHNHSLDALVLPTAYMYLPAAMLGTPVVSVPLGRTPDDEPYTLNEAGTLNVTGPNQPFGLGFAGLPFSEEKLIEMAYAFEQRTNVRTSFGPRVVPRTELGEVVKRRKMVEEMEREEL